MGQWLDSEEQQSSKQSYALSGRIMLTSIITLFVIVFFLVLLHLYARWYHTRLHRRNVDITTPRPNPRNRSTRFVYYVNNNNNRALGLGSSGLDASVLKLLPLFVYSSETDASTPECAVCLSEFEDGETGRVLPNCKHGFHTGCIDMWFCSHSTCPLCRSPVEPVQKEVTEDVSVHEPDSSMSLMETTSSEAGRKRNIDVRIDVPVNESVESEFRLTSPSQGLRLSLKRIMNMSRVSPVTSASSGVGPSCDSVATESDVESPRQVSD